MSTSLVPLLSRLLAHETISGQDVRAAFDEILAGAWTPVQVASFAVALRMSGETAEHIAAAVQSVRAAMVAVDHELPVVVDTCGTGGDGAQTMNLSSGAAVVVAASGMVVAKHGNRSASSRCGSADVFEALGIPLDVPAPRQRDVLREAGITFLYAQAHHPTFKHMGQARRDLGVRTIFNALGPLANPAHATHQLVGVYDEKMRPVLASVLQRVGTRRAWVVRSEDGLDEISPSAPTRVSELSEDGVVRERVVAPEDFGMERVPLSAVAGGEVDANARALASILDGENHPARGAVILNAAGALAAATGDDLRACAERARAAIDSGKAKTTLDVWRRAAVRARSA